MPESKTLTSDHLARFREKGYVHPFPVFSASEAQNFREEYDQLIALLPPGKDPNRVNWWHKRNRFVYDLCTDSRLLDMVEDLLGADFYLWGSHFFVKQPREESIVPWHQDAQYWPLQPQNAVTVYIAITDCDRENSCMHVVPGTHLQGKFRHHTNTDGRYVLQNELDEGEVDLNAAVPLELKAGEVSLHHDGIVHGSGANHSDRLRVGFTMRFSSTDVKCDLSVWPTFHAFLARGVDRYGHNPVGVPPTGYEAPTGMLE